MFRLLQNHLQANVDPLRTKFCDLKTQSAPRRKHPVSVIKTSQSMLYREIIAVCSEIHTQHIKALFWQKREFLKIKAGGT
jgi:hypothetical protein